MPIVTRSSVGRLYGAWGRQPAHQAMWRDDP